MYVYSAQQQQGNRLNNPACPFLLAPDPYQAIVAYNISMDYASAPPEAFSPCAAAHMYDNSMAYASPSAPSLPAGKRASLDVGRVVDVVAATA